MNLARALLAGGLGLFGVSVFLTSRKASGAAPGAREPFLPPAAAGGSGGGNGGAAFGEMLKAEFPDHGDARDARIVQAVADGQGIHEWVEITSQAGGHEAHIRVMRKALSIGVPGDALRVSTNFRTAQQIADMLGAVMLTPKVSNLIAEQADWKPSPITHSDWVNDGTMSKTKRMVEQSNIVESAVPGESPGLIANEGKNWVVTKRNWSDPDLSKRSNGANHGLYIGQKPIQDRGLMHNMKHTDYSQLLVFMDPTVIVDGQPMSIDEVVQSSELAPLISDEGTLPRVRHPDL